jgi:hypothetical protein
MTPDPPRVPVIQPAESGSRFFAVKVGPGFQVAQEWVQVFNLHMQQRRGLSAG